MSEKKRKIRIWRLGKKITVQELIYVLSRVEGRDDALNLVDDHDIDVQVLDIEKDDIDVLTHF